MTTYEFVFLPNTTLYYPSIISSINQYSSCIITYSSDFLRKKCPLSLIIERNNDDEIINSIIKNKFQLIVFDTCFWDSDISLLTRVKDLNINIIVIEQFASIAIFTKELKNATNILVPENFNHPLIKQQNFSSYNIDTMIEKY